MDPKFECDVCAAMEAAGVSKEARQYVHGVLEAHLVLSGHFAHANEQGVEMPDDDAIDSMLDMIFAMDEARCVKGKFQ
jgi:hypothetical protein